MSEFFKCLVCNKYFESLWKIQQHIQKHEGKPAIEIDESRGSLLRRGMLPIEKAAFVNCCVRLVRVDPDVIPSLKDSITSTSNSTRSTRKCRVEANIKLKEIAKVLNNSEDKKCGPKRRISTSSSSSSDFDLPSDEEFEEEAKTSSSKNKIFKFKCAHCSDTFPNKKKLSLHIFQSHKDAAADFIPCPVPHCTFPSMDYDVFHYHIDYHRKAEQKEVIFKAEDPERLKNLLSKCGPTHLLRAKGFTCKYCLKREPSLESLISHFKSHSGVLLECHFCNKADFEGSVLNFICHLNSSHPNQLIPEEERKNWNRKYSKSRVKKSLPPAKDDIKRPYPCPICLKRFSTKVNLRRHAHLHLENNPFVCKVENCNRKFNSEYNLRRHSELHQQRYGPDRPDAKYFECSICQKRYTRPDHLRRHLSSHSSREGKKRFMEAEGFVFPRASNFQIIPTPPPRPRSDVVKSETVEEIELTDNIIITEDGQAIHIKGEELTPARPVNIHVPSPKVECSNPIDTIMRDPKFKKIAESNPKALDDIKMQKCHKRRHQILKCSVCNAEFRRGYALQKHMESVHAIKSENEAKTGIKRETGGMIKTTLICRICAYAANDNEDFQEHLKTSDACRKFKCPEKGCSSGLTFGSEEELEAHINRLHKSERSHICSVCGKGFISNLWMMNHKRRFHKYGPEVKKTCPICGIQLAPVSFKTHMKRHDNEGQKEIRCKICNDTLSCQTSLQRHIRRVHLGKTVERLRVTNAAGSKGTSKGSIGQPNISEIKEVAECKIGERVNGKPVNQSKGKDEMEILGL